MSFQDQFDELVRALGLEQEQRLTTLEEVQALKKLIRTMVRRWDNLSKTDKLKLDDAEKRLHAIQRNCSHFMARVDVFTQVRMICTKCDLEDRTYVFAHDPMAKKR